MATHRFPILNVSALPGDENASILPYSTIVTTVRDQFVVDFNLTTKGTINGSFTVPKNWVGTTKLIIKWTSQTAANNVVWDFDHRSAEAGVTQLETDTTPASTAETVTTASKPGAANQLEEDEITLTTTNWAVDELVQFAFSRDAANGSDTKADNAQLFSLEIEYADA